MAADAPTDAAGGARDLSGRVAVVTGGASGIGLASARALADRGATVVCADVDGEAAARAGADHGLEPMTLDVGDAAAWDHAVATTLAEHGRLDVALLNAGTAAGVADVTELDEPTYRRVMRVNVDGVVLGLRAAARAMRDGGDVIATASLAGIVPMPEDPLYTATKHAVVGLCRAAADGLAARGVRCNAVCPGFADTPLLARGLREPVAAYEVPLLDPADVAAAVLAVLDAGDTGRAWFVQPGREPAPYEFRGVPGPR